MRDMCNFPNVVLSSNDTIFFMIHIMIHNNIRFRPEKHKMWKSETSLIQRVELT